MTTFTAIDGTTITPRTRADLVTHPAFAHLSVDSDGNPCVWRNYYTCRSCTSEQIDWSDDWSCQCDDDCPNCHTTHEADDFEWIATTTGKPEDGLLGCEAYHLWESLPEAGAAPEFGAATLAEHIADQDEITAAIEAMHADPTPCERAQQIMDETDGEPDDNRRRAARILLAIAPAYDGYTIKQGILDAMSDLLHLCDLAGFDFAEIERDARSCYTMEVDELSTAVDQVLAEAIADN